jgi:sigma-E factor negative regulatory protein RseC
MLEENAIVVDMKDDLAMLEVVRRTPCGLCGQTRGCGISVWGRLSGHHNNVFKAQNQINAQIGDNVVVGINEHALLMNAFFLYGIPLLTTLCGALAGAALQNESSTIADRHAVFGALIGLISGLLWLKLRSVNQRFNAGHQPIILRIGAANSIQNKCNKSSQ